MTTTAQTYNATLATLIGGICHNPEWEHPAVVAQSERTGKLRSGEEGHYMLLTFTDTNETKELHPREATGLFKFIEKPTATEEVAAADHDDVTEVEVLDGVAGANVNNADAANAAPEDGNANVNEGEGAGDTANAGATEVKAEKPQKAEKPKKEKVAQNDEPKAPSKKSLCLPIFNEEVQKANGDVNKARAPGIKRYMEELGLTSQGASTYWQNCRSGKWK